MSDNAAATIIIGMLFATFAAVVISLSVLKAVEIQNTCIEEGVNGS